MTIQNSEEFKGQVEYKIEYRINENLRVVNNASRLESSVAGPNEIVVSEAIYKATNDFFVFDEIGEKRLIGISKPINAYKVIRRRV